MEEQSPQILEYAELLLGEEKKMEARLLLAAYLKRTPGSADAWMLMSKAVDDEQQELDCLNRVLQYAPSYEPAQRRKKEIEASLAQFAFPSTETSQPPTPDTTTMTPVQKMPPDSTAQQGSASPALFAPAVSPFINLKYVESTEQTEEPFDLFAPGVFDDLKSSSPTFTAGEEVPGSEPSASTPPTAAESFRPAPEAQAEVPGWALPPADQKTTPAVKTPAPKKKKTWVVDVVIIGIVLCLVLSVVVYFALSDYARSLINELQPTQQTGAGLSSRPPNTLAPTWTASVTSTRPPPADTPLAPTATETPLFTPENTTLPTGAVGLGIGMYPPDFTLTELVSGEPVTLSDTRGQPVLLFFFTTWCPYCAQEVDDLQDLYAIYQEDGFIVLGINEGETLPEVEAYRLAHNLTFPLLPDTDRAVSARLYEATSIPHHVFIGVSGKITYVATGQLSHQDLENRIKTTMRVFPTVTP